MVLAIAAEMDWEVLQLDVKTAFLHADIEEEEFVEAAPGFEKTDKHGVQLLMKLGKSLYGRAQSPDNWWKTIDPLLITLEFVPLESDTCIYIYRTNGMFVYVLYVCVYAIPFCSSCRSVFDFIGIFNGSTLDFALPCCIEL